MLAARNMVAKTKMFSMFMTCVLLLLLVISAMLEFISIYIFFNKWDPLGAQTLLSLKPLNFKSLISQYAVCAATDSI